MSEAELLAVLEDGPKSTAQLAEYFTWKACRSLTELASRGLIRDLSGRRTIWNSRVWGLPGAAVPTPEKPAKPLRLRANCQRCHERPVHARGYCGPCNRELRAHGPGAPVAGPAPSDQRTVIVDGQAYESIWDGRDPLTSWPDSGKPCGSSLSGGTFDVFKP